jgi:cysteine desulfurase
MAIKGVALANASKGKHIITSSIEHHAILNPCHVMEEQGFKITYLPVDKYGIVNPDDVKKALKSDTILVSIMLANNEIGTIQPIAEIGKLLKGKGIIFHTDAVQAAGKIAIDVNQLNVDLLTISAHKMYGPKGTGALYIRQGTKIDPLLHGGHHEYTRRPGTENIAGIVGLAKALTLACAEIPEFTSRMTKLRDKLEKGIKDKISDVQLNGHPAKRLPNLLNMSFKYVEGESILLALDLKGIAASTGSACTSGSVEPSHVLLAMHVPPEIAQGSLRFSLGRVNTEEDIDYVIETLPPIIQKLREMSPLYKGKK